MDRQKYKIIIEGLPKGCAEWVNLHVMYSDPATPEEIRDGVKQLRELIWNDADTVWMDNAGIFPADSFAMRRESFAAIRIIAD